MMNEDSGTLPILYKMGVVVAVRPVARMIQRSPFTITLNAAHPIHFELRATLLALTDETPSGVPDLHVPQTSYQIDRLFGSEPFLSALLMMTAAKNGEIDLASLSFLRSWHGPDSMAGRLKSLEEIGMVKTRPRKTLLYYSLDPSHPASPALKAILDAIGGGWPKIAAVATSLDWQKTARLRKLDHPQL